MLLAAWAPRAASYNMVKVNGTVTAQGKPLAGVAVTDGRQVVTTDNKGRYSMTSDPDRRYVYLSHPAGYDINVTDGVPVIYSAIDPDSKGCFKADFNLTPSPTDDNRHILIVQADPQVYFDSNIDEVAAAAREMKTLMDSAYIGTPAVGLVVGDIVGNNKQAAEYFPRMTGNIALCGFPTFYVCGNHDIDTGALSNDGARSSFNRYFGPSYYSFNMGKVHYVVLDDVFWNGRNYMGYLDDTQLLWLERDLAQVAPGSTVIVAMHIPTYSREARRGEWGKEDPKKMLSNRRALYNLLKPYNAHIMSGHEHYNENYIISDNVYEHCHGPLSNLFWCAPWATDGTPGGYAVYEIDGDNIDWYFKSLGRDREYQFEVYPPGRSPEHPDAVVANIWNYDPTWKVLWLEDGKEMGNMTRFTGHDPNIWDDVNRNGSTYAFPYVGADITEHLFYAIPTPGAKTITVQATDHNGHTYTSTIPLNP